MECDTRGLGDSVSAEFAEFSRDFPDDDACLAYLWRTRFAADGEHALCSRCGVVRRFRRYAMASGRRAWTCSRCGLHVSPTAGTVFARSSTGLRRWFYAAFLLANTPGGVSAKRLQRELGVGYKTAWRMRELLRGAVAPVGVDGFLGDVELRTLPADDAGARGAATQGPQSSLAQLTGFVGRRTEMAKVRGLLDRSRLVSLVGAGGCGKTRLGMQVAGQLPGHTLDEAWWVDLTPLSSSQLVPSAVADALGMRLQPEFSPLDSVLQFLGERRALIALDNCEHVVDGCAETVELVLKACPAVRVLATSREPLGVAGEVVWRVPSLTTPAADVVSPEALVAYDAVRLFVDRAVEALPSFRLEENNARAVALVCRRLDGIPLAIELAAAQLPALSAHQIAEQLDESFELLTGSRRSAPPRHRTLSASMAWSHGMLGEAERVLFRRLSVFVGGFTLDAVQSVCTDEYLVSSMAVRTLAGLVAKSLVAVDGGTPGHRYRLLETVRNYAFARLAESGEADRVGALHFAYMLAMAQSAAPQLRDGRQLKWLDVLCVEQPNLRAALSWAIAHQPDVAPLRLVNALIDFYLVRGGTQGPQMFEDALAAATDEPSLERARALWGAASIDFHGMDAVRARKRAAEAVEMARLVGDTCTIAHALVVLGGTEIIGDPPRARGHLQESMELAHGAGDDDCLAQALAFTATSWTMQSDLKAARTSNIEAYAVYQRLGDRRLLAWHWLNAALGGIWRGDLTKAREAAEQAAALAGEIGDSIGHAWSAWCLAVIDCRRGHAAQAAESLADLTKKVGVSTRRGSIMYLRAAAGKCALSVADLDCAVRNIESAAHIAGDRGDVLIEGDCLADLAEAALLRGQYDRARTLVGEVMRCASAIGNLWLLASGKRLLAQVCRSVGEFELARDHCHEALILQREGGYRLDALATLDTLAALCLDCGAHVEAARLYGACAAGRRVLSIRRRPIDVPGSRADWARLRQALDRPTLGRALRDGTALSLDEAMTHAARGRGKRGRPSAGWDSLTPTESSIARLAAQGLSNPQIGTHLLISRATVKLHLTHIFRKLGVSNRVELAGHVSRLPA